MHLFLITNKTMYQKELEVALSAAKKASKVIMEVYNSGNLGVEIKSDNSPVTKADKAADKIIREELSKAFPSYSLLTEESVDNLERLNNDYCWVVDPIDGTKDFVAHDDEFSVNIGLVYKHVAVLGVIIAPVTGDIYYAIKNEGAFSIKNGITTRLKVSNKTKDLICVTSRFHFNANEQALIDKNKDRIGKLVTIGSTLKGCAIASGEADISYRVTDNTKEWDTCAMQVILEEAGGYVLKFDGTPIRYNRKEVRNLGGFVICNSIENFII